MNIPRDKQLHFLAGIGVSFVACFIFKDFVTGTLIGLLAGPVKEGYDALHNYLRARKNLPPVHTVDPFDAIATALGALVPLLFVILHNS